MAPVGIPVVSRGQTLFSPPNIRKKAVWPRETRIPADALINNQLEQQGNEQCNTCTGSCIIGLHLHPSSGLLAAGIIFIIPAPSSGLLAAGIIFHSA